MIVGLKNEVENGQEMRLRTRRVGKREEIEQAFREREEREWCGERGLTAIEPLLLVGKLVRRLSGEFRD